MTKTKDTEKVFLALLRAGLWEQDVCLLPFEPVDFADVYKLAEEQSVIGLIAAGLEHITDLRAGKVSARPFLAHVIAQELRNKTMDEFLSWLMSCIREEQIKTVVIKGQGIAQCYARPLWRAAGDIDLLLDLENYGKAKKVLCPLASSLEREFENVKHYGMTIRGFEVELHGTFHTTVTSQIDRVIDDVQQRINSLGEVRVCRIAGNDVLLPEPTNDVVLVFVHIVKHFFKGGIGLRQICDLCRLLWTFRDDIKVCQLKTDIEDMGLVSEWKSFAALMVDDLGMPIEAVPLYDSAKKYSRKARKILSRLMETGNFGYNHDNSYRQTASYIGVKLHSFIRWIEDYSRLITLFPKNAFRSFAYILTHGTMAVFKGE